MRLSSSRPGCSFSLSRPLLPAPLLFVVGPPRTRTRGLIFVRSSTRAFALTVHCRVPVRARTGRKKARPTWLRNRLPACTVLPFCRSAATGARLSLVRMRPGSHTAARASFKTRSRTLPFYTLSLSPRNLALLTRGRPDGRLFGCLHAAILPLAIVHGEIRGTRTENKAGSPLGNAQREKESGGEDCKIPHYSSKNTSATTRMTAHSPRHTRAMTRRACNWINLIFTSE